MLTNTEQRLKEIDEEEREKSICVHSHMYKYLDVQCVVKKKKFIYLKKNYNKTLYSPISDAYKYARQLKLIAHKNNYKKP